MDHVLDVIGKSPVLHGPRDEMAYLMYLNPVDAPLIVENLEMLACSRGYSKVVAKVPAKETGRFLAAGYQLEAALPCLSHEDDAACYMAKYFCSDRKTELQPLLVREVLAAAHQQQPVGVLPAPMDARVYELPESEYGRVADFLGRFSRASPVDPAPVSAARREGALFFGASANDELAALACVTVDANTASAEITELLCTKEAEEYWVNHLLQQLERELLAAGTKRLFAMARAYSFGNNIVFAATDIVSPEPSPITAAVMGAWKAPTPGSSICRRIRRWRGVPSLKKRTCVIGCRTPLFLRPPTRVN